MLKPSAVALFLLSASSLDGGSGSILVESLSSFQSSSSSSLSCRRRRSAEGIQRNAINTHRASFADEKEDGGSFLNDQILDGNNAVNDLDLDVGNHPIDIDKLRQRLRPYKTNVDIENAMTNFGRQGRIRAVLELYNSLWKLDTLRQYMRCHQYGSAGGGSGCYDDEDYFFDDSDANDDQEEEKNDQQQLAAPRHHHHFASVTTKYMRPTTRIMNIVIDAVARMPSSSIGIRDYHQNDRLKKKNNTNEKNTQRQVHQRRQQCTTTAATTSTTRTQLALDIFHHGTSSFVEDQISIITRRVDDYVVDVDESNINDDSNNDNENIEDSLSARATLTSSTTTISNNDSNNNNNSKKRMKKYGGALSPNVYTFGSLLTCLARDGDIYKSMSILQILENDAGGGVDIDIIAGTEEEEEVEENNNKKKTTKKKKYPDVILNQVIYSTVISAFANYCISHSYSYITEEDVDYENNNISTTTTASSSSSSSKIDNDEIVKLALGVLNRGIRTLSYNTMSSPKGCGSSSSSSNSMTMMGVVGYNAVISTMANTGKWRMAVQLLGEMILHSSITSNTTTTTTMIRSNPNFVPMETIRDDIYNTPLLLHQHGYMSANTKSITGDTHSFIIITPKPDSVTFGTVLSACEKSCQWTTVLDIAKAAMEYGVRLDGIALTSILHACQNLGLADEALYYLDLMRQLGDNNHQNNDDNNDNDISSEQQQQQQQRQQDNGERKTNGRQRKGARQELRGPDAVAYRLAISACARSPGGQRWQDGIRLLREMKSISSSSDDDFATNCQPDVMAYTTAIAGCSEAGEFTHAISLIGEMRKEGIQPNVMTFSAVINACATASAKMARRREEEDYTFSTTTGNNDSFATTNIDDVRLPMKRALRLLDAMKLPTSLVKPNIVTYNAAIRACAEGLNLDGAFDLLRQLKEDGLEPTIVTYGSLMTACERVGDVEAASKVFRMVKEEDSRKSIRYDKCSNEQEHLKANEIIYGAAISCCRKAHEPERALLLLRKMMSEKLEPNTVTFNTVIAALSEGRLSDSLAKSNNALLWEKALAVYRVMKSKNAPKGVSPNRKTYNILIRCLANNLQPGIAESLLIDMRNAGFVPDVDLYTMTVRSYEQCGNPIKALALMEYMREIGYDFYSVKVFDEVFKNGVKVLNRLNRIGRGLTLAGWGDDSSLSSYAMSEEFIDFIDDGELV